MEIRERLLCVYILDVALKEHSFGMKQCHTSHWASTSIQLDSELTALSKLAGETPNRE